MIDTRVDAEREAAFLEEVKRIALEAAAGMNCELFLFGSRAAGNIRRSSDFDIGVRGLSVTEFDILKRRIVDTVEESAVLHSADVVDFDRADGRFIEIAERTKVVWKSGWHT